ncbi:MAG: hypothetical protein N2234_04560, partial [Planctomycetota bacterium]|nr:hypothetical protein [Planctomycetota bacterium]
MKEKLIGKCVRLLHSKYGNKEESSANREIVEQMIFYHLHRTVNITSARNALRSIRNAYIDYNEVRITRQQELSRLLEEAGVPQEKSFVIKGLLRAIFGKESRLCLEHLRELDRARFCERLKKIEGMDDAVIEYIL